MIDAGTVREPLVTVLMPVYNGIDYLPKTVDSLCAQDFRGFEVIAIDDGSTDGSWEYLTEQALRDSRFSVHRTNTNLGTVSKVINSVRSAVRGQYFVYSSQDDTFSADWLSSMYARALETQADATVPDLVFWFEDGSRPNRTLSGGGGNKCRLLSGEEAFRLSLDWTLPGNALWRSRLLKETPYFDFAMNADEYTARYYFLQCQRVAFSAGTFYYRQDNAGAITKKFSAKSLDLPRTEVMLARLMAKHHLGDEVVSKRLAMALAWMFNLVHEASAQGLSRMVIDEKLEMFRRVVNEAETRRISRVGFRLRDRLALLAIQWPILTRLTLAVNSVRRFFMPRRSSPL